MISFRRYGIDAMSAMALGLFASLLIGTIINTIGQNVAPQSFLRRKNVVISFRRYGIDAMSAMALGLFASLLIGTIINTIGQNVAPGSMISEKLLEIGGYATSVTGPVMALAIGHALMAPPLVLYSLAAVGAACNALGGSGGPLAVFFIGIVACEIGKLVSKETKIDIIVTPEQWEQPATPLAVPAVLWQYFLLESWHVRSGNWCQRRRRSTLLLLLG